MTFSYSLEGIRVELVMVTPEMAAALLEGCKYDGQRDPSDSHIEYLKNEAAKGDGKPEWRSEFARKHRLGAVA